MGAGFADIAERLRRSTVQVRAGRRGGSGSGVIWDAAGTVITNAHVARGGDAVVELVDGRELRARLVAQDTRRDLARLEAPATDLYPAAAGDSSALRPGALVIAIGSPFGFAGALTRGVVHAVGPLAGLGPSPWVQSAIRLAPGNSGGPLADAAGRVVGINTMVYGTLGLAIPAAAVQRFIREGSAAPRLGVSLRPVHFAGGLGLLVLEVDRGSPADRASLLIGDVLLGLSGRRFTTADDLAEALEAGAHVLALDFARGSGRARTVHVQLRPGAVAA